MGVCTAAWSCLEQGSAAHRPLLAWGTIRVCTLRMQTSFQDWKYLKDRVNANMRGYKSVLEFPVDSPPGLPRDLPQPKRTVDEIIRGLPQAYHALVPNAFSDEPRCNASMSSEALHKQRYLFTKAALLRDKHTRTIQLAPTQNLATERRLYESHQPATVEILRKARVCHDIWPAQVVVVHEVHEPVSSTHRPVATSIEERSAADPERMHTVTTPTVVPGTSEAH